MDYPDIIEENGIKYHACPECGGKGEVMVARMYPSGHTECWDPCEFDYCDNGYIDELDYLAMKLEGKL